MHAKCLTTMVAQLAVVVVLCEYALQVNSQSYTNVALGKDASQSSTYPTNNPDYCHAGLAVDGLHVDSQDVNWLKCTRTQQEITPFWQVDLGKEYEIALVIVTNRGYCCGEKFRSVLVTVGNTNPPNQNCSYLEGPGTTAGKYNFTCPAGLQGRYVRLQVIHPDEEILAVCEVQVMITNPSAHLFKQNEGNEASNTLLWSTGPTGSILGCACKCKEDGKCIAFIARDGEDGTMLCDILYAGDEQIYLGQNGKL